MAVEGLLDVLFFAAVFLAAVVFFAGLFFGAVLFFAADVLGAVEPFPAATALEAPALVAEETFFATFGALSAIALPIWGARLAT